MTGVQTCALPISELPDDPVPEQVDAWIELAELVADEGFERRVREMVLAGGTAQRLPEGTDYRAHGPCHWPAGGCHSSTLFPSGSMTQANFPYSDSSIFSSTLQRSSRKALTSAWRSSTR